MQMNTAQSNNISNLAFLVNCLDEGGFAKLAGVKLSTLDSWRKRGKGPEYVLLGRSYLYPISSVQSYVSSLVRGRTTVNPKSVLI